MNNEEILKLAERNETAEVVIKNLASRQRVRKEPMDLTRVKNKLIRMGEKIDSQEFYTVFRELERLGIGKLENSKFYWKTPITDVFRGVVSTPQPKIGKTKETERKDQIILVIKGKPVKIELPDGVSFSDLVSLISH